MSTGVPIRIERDGKWININFWECSKDEMLKFLSTVPDDQIRSWLYYILGYTEGSRIRLNELRYMATHLTEPIPPDQQSKN